MKNLAIIALLAGFALGCESKKEEPVAAPEVKAEATAPAPAAATPCVPTDKAPCPPPAATK